MNDKTPAAIRNADPETRRDYFAEIRRIKALPADHKEECWVCAGSGNHYSGGAVVNGKYTGTIGACYRCNGKGYQTPADMKRNAYYFAFIYIPPQDRA